MTPRRRLGWARVIDMLERYLTLRADWPVTSPLGKLSEGGTDDVRRGESGTLMWVVDVGGCLDRMPTKECERVVEVTHVRMAEEDAIAMATTHELSAHRSGVVCDVRDMHARSKREWRRVANDHQRRRRRLETKVYERGMDRLSVMFAEIEVDK